MKQLDVFTANVQLIHRSSLLLLQRQEYKNLIKGKTSRLNDKRVELLNSLGFAWELQRGGRRRRLTVNKGSHPGAEGTPPGHPAAKTEEPTKKKPKVEIKENFPIDDGTPVRRSATGRKRTTLKKKVTSADGSSKCILPGVAIMGGGRDGPPTRSNQQKCDETVAQSRTSPDGINNNGARPPFQQQQMHPQQAFSNEALLRMLGANTGANPWQMLPNGAYQQMGNPFMGTQGTMGANPFYPMAPGPFGMNPFVASGYDPQRGMDSPRYNDGSDNGGAGAGMFPHGMGPQDIAMGRMQQQAGGFGGPGNNVNGPNQDSQNQRHPFYVPSGGGQDQQEKQQDDVGHQNMQLRQMQAQGSGGMMPQQYGVPGGWNPGMSMGQQGQYWNDSNAAAAAAAAQHLHAAAALTAGMDERALPPSLAPLASVARYMNGMMGQQGMNGPGGNNGGTGGSYGVGGNSGPQNGVSNANGMNMSEHSCSGIINNNGMPNMRGRRGDPPADPPTGAALSNMMMDSSDGSPDRGVMKKMRMKPSIFQDADE
jgi:hypothetical protein